MVHKAALVGQFPPPVHGLSKALQKIIDAPKLQQRFEMERIDLKYNKNIAVTVKRLLSSDCDFFYFTISQSKGGNVRDMMLLSLMLIRKKPVIVHYHGGYYKQLQAEMSGLQKRINVKLLPRVTCMVVLSESLKRLFDDFIPDERLAICENFVENEALLSEQEFEVKVQTMKTVHVLFLSNFIASKGYREVLQAAALLNNYSPAMFHFAGVFFEQEEEEAFTAFIEDYHLTNVRWHGSVAGEEKKALFAECNVFILPTYYPNEGQPISIVEAMANGLTVITTRHAGIPDIVGETNGCFVEAKAPQEIAQTISRLSIGGLKRTAETNRRDALSKFREEDYIQRIEKIFERGVQGESKPESVQPTKLF